MNHQNSNQKRNKTVIIFAILFMCIFLVGIIIYRNIKATNKSNPPKIMITIDEKEIKTVIGLNQWNGVKYDREDTFKTSMSKNVDIPYIKFGNRISIEFKDNPPKKITVYDYLLNEKGNYKYTDKVKGKVNLVKENDKHHFELIPNGASYLSSKLSNYEPGKTIRGFRILCNWDENECEYAFIIRTDAMSEQVQMDKIEQNEVEAFCNILPEGNNLMTRIMSPKEYVRSYTDNNSFVNFMRNLTLKEDGSPVILYNGEKKGNQLAHIAVFDMDIGEKDLQQCADSIMRIYAEYYWSNKEYERIVFHLTNNFLMEYIKWRDGYRLKVNGNNTSWVKSSTYNDSYESFRAYLDKVFIYAGTLSLNEEGEKVEISDIQVGDMFIEAGSPGHCVLVVDMSENETGDKAFLLAQGYMPAQEFHVLKNPLHEEDPWYYSNEITYPLKTPQWTFKESSLKRWMQ